MTEPFALSPIERWAAIMVRAGLSNFQKQLFETCFMPEESQASHALPVYKITAAMNLPRDKIVQHLHIGRRRIEKTCGLESWAFITTFPQHKIRASLI